MHSPSYLNKKFIFSSIFACCFFGSFSAFADGGLSIMGTRVIYPLDVTQKSISVRNSSTTDSYLVQSWVSEASGNKTSDLVVTPPLYLSKPKSENVLRIVRANGDLPRDKETLYYLTVKGIPSVDKENNAGKSILRIAAATRIKLLVRPSGLTPAVSDAPAKLTFRHMGEKLEITNPTPYYLTLTEISAGGHPVKDIMVAPKSSTSEAMPAGAGNNLNFKTINDFGSLTKALNVVIK